MWFLSSQNAPKSKFSGASPGPRSDNLQRSPEPLTDGEGARAPCQEPHPLQRENDGELYPVVYASRKLLPIKTTVQFLRRRHYLSFGLSTNQRWNRVCDTDPRPDPTWDASDPWPGLSRLTRTDPVFWTCTVYRLIGLIWPIMAWHASLRCTQLHTSHTLSIKNSGQKAGSGPDQWPDRADPTRTQITDPVTRWPVTRRPGSISVTNTRLAVDMTFSIHIDKHIHRCYVDIHAYVHINRRLSCVEVATEFPQSAAEARASITPSPKTRMQTFPS